MSSISLPTLSTVLDTYPRLREASTTVIYNLTGMEIDAQIELAQKISENQAIFRMHDWNCGLGELDLSLEANCVFINYVKNSKVDQKERKAVPSVRHVGLRLINHAFQVSLLSGRGGNISLDSDLSSHCFYVKAGFIPIAKSISLQPIQEALAHHLLNPNQRENTTILGKMAFQLSPESIKSRKLNLIITHLFCRYLAHTLRK